MTVDNLTFRERLQSVRGRMAAACLRSGRNLDDITLLAVSKTFPFARIEEAYAAGVVDFGENYIQDCCDKISEAKDKSLPLRWHFIGHLQSNKVKFINSDFCLFHSLDSEKLALRLANHAQSQNFTLNVLVQVNLADEVSKSGISPASLFDFLRKIRYIKGLSINGLMAIPPNFSSPEESRPGFHQLYELYSLAKTEIFSDSTQFNQLSMGMSKDFEVAIEEGATIVRVGSLLFGERNYKN